MPRPRRSHDAGHVMKLSVLMLGYMGGRNEGGEVNGKWQMNLEAGTVACRYITRAVYLTGPHARIIPQIARAGRSSDHLYTYTTLEQSHAPSTSH